VLRVTLHGLPAESVTEITFTVTVVERPESGYVVNYATLTPPGGRPIVTPPVEVPVLLPPTIEKDADRSPVNINDEIEYTITVNNPNDIDLDGDFVVIDNLDIDYVELVVSSVSVTRDGDQLDSDYYYIEEFDEEAGVLIVTLHGLPAESVTEITFTVIVIERPAGGYVINYATLTPPNDRPILITPPVEVPVLLPLMIDKGADTTPVYVDDEIEYTITVNNPNNVDFVGDFVVIDNLDFAYVELDEASVAVTRGGSLLDAAYFNVEFNDETGVLVVTFHGLPAESATEITFTVTVIERPESGYVVNYATLTPPGGSVLTTPPVEVPVLLPPIIEKDADRAPVNIGEEIKYTITVTNQNDIALDGYFIVTDNLAIDYVELDLESVTVSRDEELLDSAYYEVDFDEETGELTVILHGLPAESETEITFTVTLIGRPESGYVVNIATLTPPDDRPVLITPPVEVPVLLPPTIEKTADVDVANVGENIVYTITVNNPNDIALAGEFVVVDAIDTDLVEFLRATLRINGELVSVEDERVQFEESVLQVTLNPLESGNTVISFSVRVRDDASGSVVRNTAILETPDEDSPSEEVEVEVPCPVCPPCPPDETCPPCPSCRPNQPDRPGTNRPNLPNLPQTGVVVGATMLGGLVLVGSGLAVKSKMNKDK